MHEITLAKNPRWAMIPVLDFEGAPTGIDVSAVCRTGILPQINTGMAGKEAGVGQVGAGARHPAGRGLPRPRWQPSPSARSGRAVGGLTLDRSLAIRTERRGHLP